MAPMNYLDITIPDPAERADLMTRLLATVHAINTRHAVSLSVAWPEWVDPRFEAGKCLDRGTPGSKLRIFGTATALEQVLQSPAALGGGACGMLRIGAVAPVPAAHGWVRYVRERAGEKQMSPSVLRRRARRAGCEPSELATDKRPKPVRPFHSFDYESDSTGQRFGFRVCRIPLDGNDAGWVSQQSSYGLAVGAGGVPAF